MEIIDKFSTILLVDDDEVTCYINLSIIEKAGFRGKIDVVFDGTEALEYLKDSPAFTDPACTDAVLVLLDINMPAMSGIELLQELAALGELTNPCLSVVLLSSAHTPKDRAQAAKFNIAGFLTKPLTEAKLNQLLHTLPVA